MKINEKGLKSIIAESLKKVLNEGMLSDNPAFEKWEYLEDMVGAEKMLDCIFRWSSVEQIEQWIEWFEEEGYFDNLADE